MHGLGGTVPAYEAGGWLRELHGATEPRFPALEDRRTESRCPEHSREPLATATPFYREFGPPGSMSNKPTLLFAALIGSAIVLLVVWREIDSGSLDHDAMVWESSQLGALSGDALVAAPEAEVTVDKNQGRFANVAGEDGIEHPHPLAAARLSWRCKSTTPLKESYM